MSLVGIDPGKQGAICVLPPNGVVLAPMPMVSGPRPEYDVPAIVAHLRFLAPEHVFVERLQPLPGKFGGAIANYSRGFGFALIVGICSALGIPYTAVGPRVWQKEMLAGGPWDDTKQRSILTAKRLFPDVSLKRTERCKKDDDGFADALLIAEWGRRHLK